MLGDPAQLDNSIKVGIDYGFNNVCSHKELQTQENGIPQILAILSVSHPRHIGISIRERLLPSGRGEGKRSQQDAGDDHEDTEPFKREDTLCTMS